MPNDNKWSGLWRTRNGTLVNIAVLKFSDNIVLGKILKDDVVTVWNSETGNHLENENLDLISRKRDEELW